MLYIMFLVPGKVSERSELTEPFKYFYHHVWVAIGTLLSDLLVFSAEVSQLLLA